MRFNANGYDVNRHWDEVDLRRPEYLRAMPEIWYTKKAIVDAARARPIDLLVNLHNTETAEYLETHARDPRQIETVRRLSDLLSAGEDRHIPSQTCWSTRSSGPRLPTRRSATGRCRRRLTVHSFAPPGLGKRDKR